MTKVIVYVKGGLVAEIESDENILYKIVDYDNDPDAKPEDMDWSESDIITKDL